MHNALIIILLSLVKLLVFHLYIFYLVVGHPCVVPSDFISYLINIPETPIVRVQKKTVESIRRPSTSQVITGVSLGAPTTGSSDSATQVGDQWSLHWSLTWGWNLQEPVVGAPGKTPAITWWVLHIGACFSTAVLCNLPITDYQMVTISRTLLLYLNQFYFDI